MNLKQATVGIKHIITNIETKDEELNDFLFTLGCYQGEEITIVSIISGSYVVAIRDGRYNIDQELASAIFVE